MKLLFATEFVRALPASLSARIFNRCSNGPPLPPQMEGEDDNGSMINPTNADATLTTETRTSKRGSRGKNSRKLYNRKRNGVGRNGGDGGGHGDNMRRRIS